MELPEKLSSMSSSVSRSIPGRRDVGAEPVEQQHRRREGELPADLRDLEGVGDRLQQLALDHLGPESGPAGRLDLLLRGGAEGVGADGELLGQLAAPEHLHRVRASPARRRAASPG